MFAIGKKEFSSLFQSIMSLLMIALLLVTSYYSAKFSDLLTVSAGLSASEAEDIHTAGLLFLLVGFGQLFVMGLSHDTINRELHERTMRFLVTRTSRISIVLGKYLGIWLFWFVCILISFLIISLFSLKIDLFIFSQAIALVTFQIALAVLLSVLIPKPSYTMFLGVLLGIALPILGVWVAFTNNLWVSWLKFVSPYYYLINDDYSFLVIFGLAGLVLAVALALFNRREC